MPRAQVRTETVLGDDLVEIAEDLVAGRDRRTVPRLEPVGVGVEVAVGAHTREALGPPGAAVPLLGVEHDDAVVSEVFPQVVRRPDPGHAGSDDQDVDVPGLAPAPVAHGADLLSPRPM
ncbi:hypothetical protein Acsp06_49020 [Actinomycetospora sp. NBRC 106375]|nr:hypothetical protein Acsp06_49020 [Actinomycetospora sp. NBRC 106375]